MKVSLEGFCDRCLLYFLSGVEASTPGVGLEIGCAGRADVDADANADADADADADDEAAPAPAA